MPGKRSCQTMTEVWAESRARVRSLSRGRARWRTCVGGGGWREAIVRQVVTWLRWEENWRVGVRGSQRNRQRKMGRKNTFLSLALLAPTSRRQRGSTETSNLRKNGELEVEVLKRQYDSLNNEPRWKLTVPLVKKPSSCSGSILTKVQLGNLAVPHFCRSLSPSISSSLCPRQPSNGQAFLKQR